MKPFIFCLLSFCISVSVNAQEFVTEHIIYDTSYTADTDLKISDMDWIQGYWKGSGLGGYCEELWTAPHKGYMKGIFRYFRNASFGAPGTPFLARRALWPVIPD